MRGRDLKQQGLELVYRNNRDFIEEMREYAREIAADGTVTVEDLRDRAADLGIAPMHPNAWGAVFMGNDWERVGYKPSRTVSAHARIISIWRLK